MFGVSGAQMQSRTFFAALAVATAAPLLAMPLYAMAPALAPAPLTTIVVAAWVLTAYGHVLSTLWFGADPDYAPVVWAHRWRMLASLAIIPTAVGAVAPTSRATSRMRSRVPAAGVRAMTASRVGWITDRSVRSG